MDEIKVIDACMGRGKTSAAAAYMSSFRGRKNFLFITPYLKEVDRICDLCDFEQPNSDCHTKLTDLKTMLSRKKDIASSHSLFYLIDEEALELIRKNHYCLIVDESIDAVTRENISSKDFDLILDKLATIDENGKLKWTDKDYFGKFNEYKDLANSGTLIVKDTSIMRVMNPCILEAFDEVIMMTYLFGGQYQKAYLDYFGFKYKLCGIHTEYIDKVPQYTFTDEPDSPPPVDYRSLITIIDDKRLNAIGEKNTALSKRWFLNKYKNHKDIVTLRHNINTVLRRKVKCRSKDVIWTSFKDYLDWLVGDGGRFKTSFVSLTSRATNEYRNKNVVIYAANRFCDPNILKFFREKGCDLNEDEFALGEMLQFIWRSAIRDNKPITVYIPSKRMRELLIKWIDERSCDINSAK